MNSVMNWRGANPRELEPQFSIWMNALTAEGLHQKADIAIVLAMLDREINARNAELDLTHEKLSRYEHWTPDHTIEEWCAELKAKLNEARLEISEARAALYLSPINAQGGTLADNIRNLYANALRDAAIRTEP